MMKKYIFLCLVLVLVAVFGIHPAFATNTAVNLNVSNGVVWAPSNTVLSGVTATGAGSNFYFKMGGYSGVPVSKHMCTVTWAGTAPTDVVVAFECSGNGTDYAACTTVTVTASPTVFHVDKPGVVLYRGNYVSKTGGDGTTAVTMSCVSGGY